jgi:hypothetical protein
MESRSDFSTWLSKKIYLINVGTYATIGLVMVLPTFFAIWFGIAPWVAGFVAFFVVLFVRAAYENVVVYEAPIKNLSLYKMLILSLVSSGVMSLVAVFLKPKLGYFAIPVSVMISFMVIAKVKAALWPATAHPGFFLKLPAKLDLNKFGVYGFYGFLVGITYLVYAKYGFNFYYAFAAAFFVGVIFEESYNVIKLYEQQLTTKLTMRIILWAAFCAMLASAIVWMMMQQFGYSGQVATIVSVITAKLVQPLGLRKFILARDNLEF